MDGTIWQLQVLEKLRGQSLSTAAAPTQRTMWYLTYVAVRCVCVACSIGDPQFHRAGQGRAGSHAPQRQRVGAREMRRPLLDRPDALAHLPERYDGPSSEQLHASRAGHLVRRVASRAVLYLHCIALHCTVHAVYCDASRCLLCYYYYYYYYYYYTVLYTLTAFSSRCVLPCLIDTDMLDASVSIGCLPFKCDPHMTLYALM